MQTLKLTERFLLANENVCLDYTGRSHTQQGLTGMGHCDVAEDTEVPPGSVPGSISN